MLEYGDFLMEFYQSLHPELSSIYEDINFIPLPHLKNYSGYLHRGVDQGDLDLLGANYPQNDGY